jgi:hypothetical protein
MSDQWETFCDVGYYHMWRLRRKTERGWNDGFHINTKAEAEGLCELLNKIERELATVTEQRDRLAKACDQYSEDESLCKLHEVTEQRDRLVEERDELKKQLIDAKSSTAFWMGKYNNAIQLRGEDPLCDSFWKTLDKLSAERALADRLADALTNPAVYVAVDALMAWKEARSE